MALSNKKIFFMKNKLFWIVLILSISLNSTANAAERTITTVIKEMTDGVTFDEEIKKGVVLEDQSFTFGKIDHDLALYTAIIPGYPTVSPFTLIFVKVEPNHFYTENQKLPKGKYKLVDIGQICLKPNQCYNVLNFERVK